MGWGGEWSPQASALTLKLNLRVSRPSHLSKGRCRLSLAHSNQVLRAQREQFVLKAQWETGPQGWTLDTALEMALCLHGGEGLACGPGTRQVLNK